MIRLCDRCGRPERRRAAEICVDCGCYLPNNDPLVSTRLLKLFAWCCAIVAAVFALLALHGCGPAFTAQELSNAGAGGYPQTMSQAGAGGREVSNGDAGPNMPSAAGGLGGAAETTGGAGGDSSGGAAGAGGRGMVEGGIGGEGGSHAPATCLTNWRGSACDTCSSSSSSSGGGRSCSNVLDCFASNHCTPATCAALCEYNEPTSDAAVHEAERVSACRCGGVP